MGSALPLDFPLPDNMADFGLFNWVLLCECADTAYGDNFASLGNEIKKVYLAIIHSAWSKYDY